MTRMVVSWCVVASLLLNVASAEDDPVKVAAKPKPVAAAASKTGKNTPPAPPVPSPAQVKTKNTAPKTSAPAKSSTTSATPTPPKPVATTSPKPVTTTKSEPAPKSTPATASTAGPATGKTYLLRYKFNKGETLRWDVEHQATVRMTVGGTTQTADTFSKSVKLWKVSQVDKQGRVTFIHSVESIQMRQKFSGRQEITYDSTTDKEAPVGFQDVAKSVGQPLSSITLDATGKILKRDDLEAAKAAGSKNVTIPLPEEPVAIGYKWTMPDDIVVSDRGGQPKKIERRQQFTLEEVKNGFATIKVETQVLTPVSDPSIEAQLVQGETNGTMRFDLQAGRMTLQELSLDKHVVGVQGDTSAMHYTTRFTERLAPSSTATAAKPVAGPQPATKK